MTYREFLNGVLAILINLSNGTENVDELTITNLNAYAAGELEKLNAKNDKRKNTLTKNQTENEEMKKSIYATMENDKIYTAAELATAFDVSTQKISALLKQLADKKAVEVIDKYKPENSKSKVKGYKKIE